MADDKEPSMEEILASIRRIITEEGDEPAPQGTLTVPEPSPPNEEPLATETPDVLELTQPLPELSRSPLVSDATAAVTSQTLAALSNVAVRGYDGAGNTLEDVVRELLKPMLREWLDANLPGIVERIVTREVERITRA